MYINTAQTYYFHLIDSANVDVPLTAPVTVTLSNPNVPDIVKTATIISPGYGSIDLQEHDVTIPGEYTVIISNNGVLSHASDTVTFRAKPAPIKLVVTYGQPTTLDITVTDEAGSPVNLTGKSLGLYTKIQPSTHYAFTGSVSIVNAVAGTIAVFFTPPAKGVGYLLVGGIRTFDLEF